MSSLTSYNGLQVLTPEPSASGGKAISDNFKALSTPLHTANPGTTDDKNSYFSAGSRWFNTATGVEWVCTDASVGSAQWKVTALWSASGSAIYYTGGKVGIGTSAPGAMLAVTSGPARDSTLVLNTTVNTRQIILSSNTTDNSIRWDSSAYGSSNVFSVGLDIGGNAGFAIFDETSGNSPLFIDNNDNVGIGTTSPSAQLEVVGTTSADSYILKPQSSAPSSPTAGQIYFDSSAGHFYGWDGTAWKQLDN
jgi:hypothetical protein